MKNEDDNEEYRPPLDRATTHKFLLGQAVRAELMRQTPDVADLLARANSRDQKQIASWLLRYTRMRRGFGNKNRSFGFSNDRQFVFNLKAAEENPYWTIPDFTAELNHSSLGVVPLEIWSTGPEMREALRTAFNRFLVDPSPLNRKNLDELVSQYTLTDSGRHPYVYAPVYSGGLPGLGKRHK